MQHWVLRRAGQRHPVGAVAAHGVGHFDHPGGDLVDVDALQEHLHLAGLDPRQIQDLVDQVEQVGGRL